MTKLVDVPATRARRPRAARIPILAVALTAGPALLLGGCSNSGAALAQAACVHIYDSIHLYTEAEHATSTATVRAEVDRATSQLNQALPLAARANSADPAFNPLMTTLQEAGRTAESNLIAALRAQCEAANNPTSQSPVPGATTAGTVPAGAGPSG